MSWGSKRWWLGAAAAVVLGLVIAILLRPAAPAANSIERLAIYHDPALMQQAWAMPVARRYGPNGFVYQRNPSVCGPTSIADLLRSEGRTMSAEHVLDGTGVRSIFGLLPGGVTLDEEAALLKLRTGKPVTVLRGLSLAAFRKEIAQSNDPARRYVVNFTREPLFGRGHGHFSPVLGYMTGRDLVFVGDVNGDYRPWLVSVERLYAAQDTIDPATHAKRGLLMVPAP